MSLLKLKDLQVSAGGKDILFGINLNVNKGEVHVIMGPNGSGKSTLANALVGNPEYSIDGGEILLERSTEHAIAECARLMQIQHLH